MYIQEYGFKGIHHRDVMHQDVDVAARPARREMVGTLFITPFGQPYWRSGLDLVGAISIISLDDRTCMRIYGYARPDVFSHPQKLTSPRSVTFIRRFSPLESNA